MDRRTTKCVRHSKGKVITAPILKYPDFSEEFITTDALIIVWAVKHFRPYVYGTKFKIVTDHKPLIWLFNVNDPD